MRVVIVAKTRMGSGACVGALTFEGRSLRLVAADRDTNDHFNLDYQVGEVWEIETKPDPEIIPPHIENVIVTAKRRLGPLFPMDAFIQAQMTPVSGGREAIFEGLAQQTQAGALYIAARTGLPGRSTMFWRPEKPLRRDDDHKRIRYRYPAPEGGFTLTFTGFQEPVEEIPAGSLVRVSLAHWWRPDEMPEGELRCYVQISGWFLPDGQGERTTEETGPVEKEPCAGLVPEIEGVLQKVFGYAQFHPLQGPIIENVLCKRDTLAVMPTGSGKSLCYQLPATLFPGLTVVVSPLISLMEDQVLELREWGIPAVYLNSTLDHAAYIETMRRVRAGEVKLLYAAPETLLRPEIFLLLEACRVDCLVIDEAHCISEWGHDFRPEYRQLAGLRDRLPQAVTLALTATATRRVRKDIQDSLGIAEANQFISSFDRANLFLSVIDKNDGLSQARAFLEAHRGQSGIVYCNTRAQVDDLTAQLEALGFPVLAYHAGMDDASRRTHQHRFRYEDGLIVVATIAFGMGINKSNVRFILHYQLPKNIESYYQQIGRAGRDGLRADCLTLFSAADLVTHRFFIDQEPPELRPGSNQRLQALLDFMETLTCRRVPLLAYFGERYTAGRCEACDNCLADAEDEGERTDLTIPARLLLACALETGEIFGSAHLIDILRGSRSKKVRKFDHEKTASHGAGKAISKEQWQQLATYLIRQGLLERSRQHSSLKVTAKGKRVLDGEAFWGVLPAVARLKVLKEDLAYDQGLFEALRALRASLAEKMKVPPYVIFPDRSLVEMATYLPRTDEALGQIYGVGSHKVENYGPHFLPIIRKYCQENDLKPVPRPKDRARTRQSHPGGRTADVWQRFQAGESIAEIASDFGVKERTVLGHLVKAHQQGRALRVNGLKAVSQLAQEEQRRVLAAFDELGDGLVGPVFDALGGQISYDELNLWRLIRRVEKGGEK